MTTEALVPAAAAPAIATGGAGEIVLPQVIVDAGPQATARFLEFFAGRIANARTRAAYGRAVGQFLGWCEARGLGLRDVSPLHVAAYIRTHPGSAPTVKQHLAAIRMLGDWLVVSQVLPVNPAAAVRGPKHVVTKGATPVLSPAEARKLLETIDTGALAGLRDRALLSVMLYSFARVSAVLGMRRQDYFGQGSRGWLRLHEKGGKRHDVPAHHRAAAALDAYVEAGRIEEPKVLIGYARVSKTDGSQSLDLQRDTLRAAGVDDAVNLYHDLASGVRDDRPGLDNCLRALRKGDVLVVWKLDRLGRNLAHLVNTVQDLSTRGVGLRVLAGQGAQIDTTTAGGHLVFGIFAALAEFERELIRERTVAGLKAARARGRRGGRPRCAGSSASGR